MVFVGVVNHSIMQNHQASTADQERYRILELLRPVGQLDRDELCHKPDTQTDITSSTVGEINISRQYSGHAIRKAM